MCYALPVFKPFCGAELEISLARQADVDDVMRLARACIDDMRQRGIDQWDEIYPSYEKFAFDASAGTLYLGSSGRETAIGTFALDETQDPE